MESFIGMLINGIFGTRNIDTSSLILTPQSYNASMYDAVMHIMNVAVKPVAYVILALMFLLELYNITLKSEGMSSQFGGMDVLAKSLIKLSIAKLVVDMSDVIMNGIFHLTSIIAKKINQVSNSESQAVEAANSIKSIINDMGWKEKILACVILILIFLIFKLGMIAVNVVILGRMFEIYIYMTFAPLPFATFPNSELSQIGKNFLKGFAAVCLQGVIILAIVYFYSFFSLGRIEQVTDGNYVDVLLIAAGSSFVLITAVFTSSRMAKMITNAFG